MEAIAAVKQPSTLNLGTILETMIRHNPLIKNKKSPKVKIVGIIVRNIKIGLTTALTKARIIAAINAVKKPST